MASVSPALELGARRNARIYLLGLAASLVGDSALSLVAGIWVKTLTGSSAAAAAVSACIYAPSLPRRTATSGCSTPRCWSTAPPWC